MLVVTEILGKHPKKYTTWKDLESRWRNSHGLSWPLTTKPPFGVYMTANIVVPFSSFNQSRWPKGVPRCHFGSRIFQWPNNSPISKHLFPQFEWRNLKARILQGFRISYALPIHDHMLPGNTNEPSNKHILESENIKTSRDVNKHKTFSTNYKTQCIKNISHSASKTCNSPPPLPASFFSGSRHFHIGHTTNCHPHPPQELYLFLSRP